MRAADRPADHNHHYGHGKVENAAGVVEALLIAIGAAMIVLEAVDRIRTGELGSEFDLGIVVMAASVAANIGVGQYLLRASRRSESVAIEATAWHHITDVYTSVGVLLGLVAVRLTGFGLLDPLVAIAVALFILKAAWDIGLKAGRDLLDESLPSDERDVVEAILTAHAANYVEYHNLRSRKSGGHRYMDLHLVVDSRLTVAEAHDLCEDLELHIEQALPRTSVVIHVDPRERARAAARA